jgi:hypothetical protein
MHWIKSFAAKSGVEFLGVLRIRPRRKRCDAARTPTGAEGVKQ